MPKIFSSRSASLPLAAAVLALTLSAGYFALAWTEPSGTMPISVDGPITTGSESQTKAGSLSFISGLTVTSVGQSFALQANKAPYAGNLNFVVGQDGNTGLGTATPATGSKLHIVQNTYKYLDTIVESALPSVRLADSEAGQKAYGILVDGSQLFIDSYSYADRFLNNYGSHLLTIDADGNINIAKNLNVAGNITGNKITANTELCVGSCCVNNSDLTAIKSSAGGGGGESITIPANLTPSGTAVLGSYPQYDFAFDPSSNRLSVVAYGDLTMNTSALVAKTITLQDNLSESSVSFASPATGSGVVTVGSIPCSTSQGQTYYTGRRYSLSCSGYGVACLATEDNLNECSYYNGSGSTNLIVYGYNRFSNIYNYYNPTKLRTDGTYLYAISPNNYAWKIKFEGGKMVVVEQGNSILPSVNGIGLINLGKTFPYKGSIYSASLSSPDYYYYYAPRVTNTGNDTVGKGVVGYPEIILKKTGSY